MTERTTALDYFIGIFYAVSAVVGIALLAGWELPTW